MFGKNKNEVIVNNQVDMNKEQNVVLTKDELQEEIIVNNKGKQKVLKKTETVIQDNIQDVLKAGSRDAKDFIAPASIDRSSEDHLVIEKKVCRSFVVNGFPSLVSIGWLDDLYNFACDLIECSNEVNENICR